MSPESQQYVLLDIEKKPVEDQCYAGKTTKCSRVLLAGLLLSSFLNLFLFFMYFQSPSKIAEIGSSAYAHLVQDYGVAWSSKSPYFGEDEAMADRIWEEIRVDNGTVALHDSYVEAMGLPTSQRFPWDQDKGLYLLNGFHSMHCLKTIRQTVLEFDRGLERSEPTRHILHCLDALRQDIICYADDTPRYTGFQPSGRSGTGQSRQCRSWTQLEAWAQQHTACWRYTNPHDPDFDPLKRHKFCPDGSPYIAKVKKVFGDL